MEFGFVPLNIFYFHANRLFRSRIGWAQALRVSVLASILDKVSMDNFCHPDPSEGEASCRCFAWLRCFASHCRYHREDRTTQAAFALVEKQNKFRVRSVDLIERKVTLAVPTIKKPFPGFGALATAFYTILD